jgi:endonuclease/exonuclease/phosphatase family metal-dependent hydrolase
MGESGERRGDDRARRRGPAGRTGRRGRTLGAGVLAVGLLTAGTCTGSGDDGSGDDGSGELSVLTYNVAGLPQEISTVNPEEHIPLISPLLNEYDIVLTQEDFDWWTSALDDFDFVNYHDRLRAEATHEHRSEQHPGPEAAGIDQAARGNFVGDGNGVLSRVPFTGNTRIAWSGCFGGADTSDGGAGDCLAMKGFAMVTLTLPSGAEVDLYTLHAEAGGTDEDQRLQVENFAQLADHIEEHSGGRAVILGGDTNLHTDDTHPDGDDGADTEIWDEFLLRTGLTDACTATGCAEPGSIDKIAYRGGADVLLEATSHDMPRERFRTADGEDLSDHPPVVVELTWTTPDE